MNDPFNYIITNVISITANIMIIITAAALVGLSLISIPRYLKGSFTIFLFFVRTHILDSNEVWYS